MANGSEQKALAFEGFEPFDAHSSSYWTRAGDRFLKLLREGVQTSGDKQGAAVAAEVGAHPSQFSDALTGKNGRHFSALWIPRAMQADPQNRALGFLAGIRSHRIVPHVALTKAQIAVLALEAMVSDGEAGRALLIKAFGREADAVVRSTLGENAP
jgi:hypothetical protein